jgi:very-short-patch-repair endonuclease
LGAGGMLNHQNMRNKLIRYNPELRKRARNLRNNATYSEVLLWSKIRRKSLGYEFHRQVPIDGYIVDFYCHELNLAIEVDGSSHENKFDYDMSRQRVLERLGVRFIRFENIDVNRNMIDVLRALERVILEIEESKLRSNNMD